MLAAAIAGVLAWIAISDAVAGCAAPGSLGQPGAGVERLKSAIAEPAKVTITTTLFAPSFLSSLNRCDGSIGSSGPQPIWVSKIAPGVPLGDPEGLLGRRHLGSSTSGSLELKLVPVETLAVHGYEYLPSNLEATAITRAGSYAGVLTLGPVTGGPALEVTVHAQDFFLWPLLFLLAGSGVTWWLVRRADSDRPRELLRASLKGAQEAHQAFRESDVGKVCRYHLDPLFPKRKEAADDPDALPDEKRRYGLLWDRISKARSEAALKDIAAEVADLTTMVTRLADLCRADSELRAVRDRQGQLESELAARDELSDVFTPPSPMRAETERFLGEPFEFTTARAMDGHLARLKNQANATADWLRAARYYVMVWDAWDAVPPTRRPDDPRPILEVGVWLATTSRDLQDRGAFEKLLEIHTLSLQHAGGDYRRAAAVAGAAVPQSERPSFADTRSSTQILASVETRDTFDFLITALISAVVFFLGIYVGKDFGGSPWDYVSAFVAGAAGTVAINWKLLPWYRSYKYPEPAS